MTSKQTPKLTDGQQGVIRMYDNEIASVQRQLKAAEAAWVNGGSYDAIRECNRQLDRLTKERRETLVSFEAENAQQHADVTTAPEPQTAAYQAAVDNIYFEQTFWARQIKGTWILRDENERYDGRIDYIVDLTQRMEWALETNGRSLGYRIANS